MAELLPGLALLGAAVCWGITFPLVKDALLHIGVFEFLAIRFAIAAVVLSAIRPSAARDAFRIGRKGALIVGGLLALGHFFQTLGLHLTRSTNAGFITGLYVVFTPLIAAVLWRKLPHGLVALGVVLTTIGLALLSLHFAAGHISANFGDVLVLFCAVTYGGQIVALGYFAKDADPIVLSIQQFTVVAVFFAVLLPTQPITAPTGGAVWIGILATALGSSVFGISVQTWAQKRVSPTRASVIMSSEAVWAAVAAFFLAGERLPGRAWIGAALILAGMLVVELRPKPIGQEI